ncbi:MAG: ferrous iron transport protein A, partial [SAR324 cluster bacterium]|nr:ferrous iron transport protein A [SAR324 cluster bacterium]
EVLQFAPLGDPMIVKCSNCSLALRKDEARCVSVLLS